MPNPLETNKTKYKLCQKTDPRTVFGWLTNSTAP